MAEDGIEDYALAKRKAARQAGMPDTRELPTNEEIDAALQLYQSLYHRGRAPRPVARCCASRRCGRCASSRSSIPT